MLSFPVHEVATVASTLFSVTAVLISVVHISRHIAQTKCWGMTKYTVRILLLVPVFSLDCWWALCVGSSDRKWTELLTAFRELYEAFAVFSFLQFLLAYLGGAPLLVQVLEGEGRRSKHFPPFSMFLREWAVGAELLALCFRGVLQYVIVALATTVTSLLVWTTTTVENDDEFTFQSVVFWTALIKNFSQIWALYCLVLFYRAIHHKLASVRPLAKFLCIKGLVFFTFWQTASLNVMQFLGVIQVERWGLLHSDWSNREVAVGVGNFILCIEMFFFALAHSYAYPYDEFALDIPDITRGLSDEIKVINSPHSSRQLLNVNNSVNHLAHLRHRLLDGVNFIDVIEASRELESSVSLVEDNNLC